jgi:hypothetical protein
MGYVRKTSAEIENNDNSVLFSESEGKATVISTSSARTHASMPGQFLPFGKRPFGNRRLPALSKKPEYIFLVGREEALLKQREQLLRIAGYKSISISPEEAVLESRKPQETISVFCHSLTSVERVQLSARFLRYTPSTRLLLVSQRSNLNFEVMLFHGVVALEDGPEVLVQEVHRLAKVA